MKTSQTSPHFPRPEHRTAEKQGCHKQGKDSSNGSRLDTAQIFSASNKKKILCIWDSADTTLLPIKRKIKSFKGTNYGKESLYNYWSNLFSLSQLDGVKILHNISKELTQFVSYLFMGYYSQEIQFNEQGYV